MAVSFRFSFDKFLAAIQHMATEEVPELDTYKILKLLFLADKQHLVRFGRPITGDRYVAMEYGPVGSESYDLIKGFTSTRGRQPVPADARIEQMASALELDVRFLHPRFSAKTPPEFSCLSPSDLMALDRVVEKFGAMGFNELRSITHSVYAYRKTWRDSPNGTMSFEDFFEEDSDAIEGARELMLENAETLEAFPSIDDL